MSCPQCKNEDVSRDEWRNEPGNECDWSLAMDEHGNTLVFCPFCAVRLPLTVGELQAFKPLAWTREKPTKPGVYWATRQDDGYMSIIDICREEEGWLWVDYANDQSLHDWEWFWGPLDIVKPEPPAS